MVVVVCTVVVGGDCCFNLFSLSYNDILDCSCHLGVAAAVGGGGTKTTNHL
jgi:hypothetical protein